MTPVSCVMPCGYGTKYFRTALNCFLQQDYAGPLELIIVDNNTEPIAHLLTDSRIKYVRCARMPVGALRNLGTSYATGEICISCDEDDWYSPHRVTAQVQRLRESGKAVTGWHSLLFYDMSDGLTYRYNYRGVLPYCCGTSQCYTKKWWEQHKFPSTGVEDYYFQKEAAEAGQLDSAYAGQLCVVRSHRDSKCPPRFGSAQFPSVSRSEFPQDFFTCLES